MPTPITSAAGVEALAIAGLGLCLILLSSVLHRRKVLRAPAAIALAFAGILAVAWKYPDIVPISDDLKLPFEVAGVQFFAALSLSMMLFSLDVFTRQARVLARSEEKIARASLVLEMAAIIESADEAIVGVSPDGGINAWNPAATRIFGHEAEEVRNQSLGLLAPSESKDVLEGSFRGALSGHRTENLETVLVKKDGTPVGVSMTMAPVKDPQHRVSGVSIVARDISERIKAEELRKVALLDELTGLTNRRGFTMRAEREIKLAMRDERAFNLLFIDLNNLKTINDSLGHQQGDEAICDAALLLTQSFRDTDVVARIGGDEFCVLMTGDGDDSTGSLMRLQKNVDAFNEREAKPYDVRLSVGQARFDPSDPVSLDQLIEAADSSMYEQKRSVSAMKRLLVCDDDPSILALSHAMFDDDYEVFTTLSGNETLTLAAKNHPDLILLDLNLPDVDGREVARRLRADVSTKLIPIIMITGVGDDSSEVESLKAGVDDYVEKPFDEDRLRARMETILTRRIRR